MVEHTQNRAVRPLSPPALYYPYADFQSEEWVKLALLNWHRIQRIKPEGYPLEDSAATARIRELLPDWLRDVTPNDRQLDDVAQQFAGLIATSGSRLRERYAVDKRDEWPTTLFGNAPRGADKRLAYVFGGDSWHGGKLSDVLAEALGDFGLVLAHKVGGATWYGLNPQLAAVYMCALTEIIAADRALVPVTDSEKVHRNAKGSTLDRLEQVLAGVQHTPPAEPARPEEVESQYLEIAVRSVLNPLNLAEISVDRIIDFRGSHQRELQAFQDHVFGLRADIVALCQISDEEELRQRLADLYRDRTEPELVNLRKALRQFGIRSVTGLLKLRVEKDTIGGAVGAGVISCADPALARYAVPSGIAVVAFSYVARQRQTWEHLKRESPASLLLSLERELATA